MSGKRYLRTNEVANLAGVSIATLRYYERRGLIQPPDRTPSGYRSFELKTVTLIRIIKGAQALGFSLKEIHGLIALRRSADHNCYELYLNAQEKLADLELQLVKITKQRDGLAEAMTQCDRDHGRAAVECAMFDRLAELGQTQTAACPPLATLSASDASNQ